MFHEFEQVKREYDELFETVLRDKVINTEISPEDGMFPPGQEKARYFGVGLSALRAISVALALAGKTPAGIYTVLDFACGHGRVARLLRAAFPQAHLTVSDVDQKGMAFCARTFQAEPAPSSRDLAKLRLNRRFDLIWCGSLLTHLDSPQWIEVLRFFRDHLNPMGVMIFTTHGRYVADRLHRRTGPYRLTEDRIVRVLNAYWREGFGFSRYNDNLNYGISVANPSWVIKLIKQYPDIHLLNFTEKGWAKHQDVVACIKESMTLGYNTLSKVPYPNETANEKTRSDEAKQERTGEPNKEKAVDFHKPIDHRKADLITTAITKYNVQSFVDLGGCWGVDGGYTFHALAQFGVQKAYIVDWKLTARTMYLAKCYPELTLITGYFGSREIVTQMEDVDAIILYDVLLHQVKPNWDELISLYSSKTRAFVVWNPMFLGAKTTIRLIDLGLDKYLETTPYAGREGIIHELFNNLDNICPGHNRPYRDVISYWQWGITDGDLVQAMWHNGFKLDFMKNYGRFGNLTLFENHGFLFSRHPDIKPV